MSGLRFKIKNLIFKNIRKPGNLEAIANNKLWKKRKIFKSCPGLLPIVSRTPILLFSHGRWMYLAKYKRPLLPERVLRPQPTLLINTSQVNILFWLDHTQLNNCSNVCLFTVPYGDQIKDLHREILKTGVLQKDICEQILRDTVSAWIKKRTNKISTRMNFV